MFIEQREAGFPVKRHDDVVVHQSRICYYAAFLVLCLREPKYLRPGFGFYYCGESSAPVIAFYICVLRSLPV